jgi:hypothetical protein
MPMPARAGAPDAPVDFEEQVVPWMKLSVSAFDNDPRPAFVGSVNVPEPSSMSVRSET